MVFVQDHVQSVRQRELRVRDVQPGLRRGRRRRRLLLGERGRAGDEQQRDR